MALDMQAFYLSLHPAGAGRQWISPTGNDANPGTLASPKQSPNAALNALGTGGGIVWMLDGNYGELYISGRNYSGAGWAHLMAVNERGAFAVSAGNRGITFTSCSYLGFYGIDAQGIDDPSHQWQDAIGSLGNVHHIAIWKCHTHDGAGAGIGFAGNLGPTNNVSICYNTSHRNSRWLSTAGSGIGCFEFWNTIGSVAHNWIDGYDNFIVGNVSYDNENDPSTAASDGNGIIVDDMRNTQSYGGPTGQVYQGRWLVLGNLTLDNGGRGVHAFESDNVDELFNTLAHNMKSVNDTNSGDISQVFSSGGRADYNVVKIGPFFNRTKWVSQYATDAAFSTNVCLAGDPAYGVNTRNRSSEGFNYFANNAPTLAPQTAALAAQWRPDGGSGAVEKVVLDQATYDRISRWPDMFGDLRPARAAGWALGFTEATPAALSAPTSVFQYAPASVYIGQPVAFTDRSTGGATSWLWAFGDGTSSTLQNPTHTYSPPTAGQRNYTVTLTATNAQGSNTSTQTLVARDPAQGITLQAEDGTITSGYPAVDAFAAHIIADNPGFQGTGYLGNWGQIGEKIAWTLTAPAGAGSYALTWRYRTPEVGATRDLFVNGAYVGSVAVPSNVAAYSGPFGDTAPITAPLVAGTNTIELRFASSTTYSAYCDLDSMTVATVGVVQPPPTASFTLPPATIYVGQAVPFTDTSTGAPTAWAWTFGDELVAPIPGTFATREAADLLAGAGGVSGGAVGPSGQAMPTGNLTGWRQVYAQDFNTDHPIGSFGPLWDNVPAEYAGKLHVYEDGWKDTAGSNNGTPSIYMPSQVLSTAGGMLQKYLFNNGSGARSAVLVCGDAQLYGRYTIRFRSEAVPGFKTAWLLWPASGVWPRDGEIDFPEGPLTGTISGFMHRQNGTSGSDQDFAGTSAVYTAWHTATIEWRPNDLRFYLDGTLVGGPYTSRVPNTPMQWDIQTESNFGGAQPAVGVSGRLYIDWIAMYAYDLSIA